jgi:hypothetical protein
VFDFILYRIILDSGESNYFSFIAEHVSSDIQTKKIYAKKFIGKKIIPKYWQKVNKNFFQNPPELIKNPDNEIHGIQDKKGLVNE